MVSKVSNGNAESSLKMKKKIKKISSVTAINGKNTREDTNTQSINIKASNKRKQDSDHSISKKHKGNKKNKKQNLDSTDLINDSKNGSQTNSPLKMSNESSAKAEKLKLLKQLNDVKKLHDKTLLKDNSTKYSEDSDTDTDTDADDAAVKSYKDDFGFKKHEQTIKELHGDDDEEEQTETEKEAAEEKERIRLERLASRKRKKLGRDDTELERTLCIDNVNVNTNKKTLLALLKKYGMVESMRFRNVPVENTGSFKIRQIMNQKLNKNRTSMTAYAKFSNKEQCQSAMEAHLTVVDDHHLLFRYSVARDNSNIKKDLKQGCTALVGGLPKDAEEEKVYSMFEKCGTIADVTLPRFKGISKGVAFIAFKNAEALPAALQLDGTRCCGRFVRVTKAVRKVKKNKQNVSGSGKTGYSSKKSGIEKNKPPPKTAKLVTKSQKVNDQAKPSTNVHGRLGAQKNADKKNTNSSAATNKTPSGSDDGQLTKKSAPTEVAKDSVTPGGFTGQKFDQAQKSTKRKRRTRAETKKLVIAKKLAATAPKSK